MVNPEHVEVVKQGAEAIRGAANLRAANLYEANLYEANLRAANLYEANLGRTYLDGVQEAHQAHSLETVRFTPTPLDTTETANPPDEARHFENCSRLWPERWFDWERLRVGPIPTFVSPAAK